MSKHILFLALALLKQKTKYTPTKNVPMCRRKSFRENIGSENKSKNEILRYNRPLFADTNSVICKIRR